MERENKRANWMNSRRMMQFYRQAGASPDGSLVVKIKKQNNAQPVGSYLD